MTDKEALDWCEQFENNVIMSNIQGEKTFLALKAMVLCKAALIKQIPLKPQSFDSVPHNRCPNCKNAVRMYRDSPHFNNCHWCGQALDWSKK